MRNQRFMTLVLTAGVAGCIQPPTATSASAPVARTAVVPPAPMAAVAGPIPKFVPPSRDPSAVPSGMYKIDPAHTQVMFSVMHLRITPFYGTLSQASGSLTIDAKNPAADQLVVGVPVDSIYTTSPKLTDELKSKAWLDSSDYPTMTFKSAKVTLTGRTTAKVFGELTLHGVTKPITLIATFTAAGQNPMMHLLNVGFTVTGTIKRSDFGVDAAIPLVSDETKLTISAAFVQ